MDLFPDSDLSSAVLQMKYGPLPKRRRDINSACRSGTRTSNSTIGAIPTEPNTVSPTSSGLKRLEEEDLLERLARLATAPRRSDSPPIETYTTTSGEHGEVYKATREFIDWLRCKVPGYGVESSLGCPAFGGSPRGEGEELNL